MFDHDTDQPVGVCRVGGHHHDSPAAICNFHLETGRAQLAALPRLVADLTRHLVPGATLPGEKVTTSRIGSPTPARLDVLTLVGPGTTEIRRDRRSLVPQVRRWSTLETRTVAVPRGHGTTLRYELVRRQVRIWHRELIVDPTDPGRACRCGEHHPETPRRPLLVADNDQVGLVPPAEWADLWVRRWRRELGHPVPAARTRLRGLARLIGRPAPAAVPLPAYDRVAEDPGGRLADAAVRESLLMAAGRPWILPAVAAYVTIQRTYADQLAQARARVAAAMLGLDTDTAGRARTATVAGLPAAAVTSDRAAAEWTLRYGGAVTAAHVAVDAGHLADWLPHAAERDDTDVGEFLTELRAMVAELEHTLGETRDDQWIGRCPAELRDDQGDPTGRICGYGLWQDPYRSRVECPRCHAAWPEADWLTLAQRIRVVWPVDRRRLYTLADRAYAEKQVDRLPRCRGCELTMAVQWRAVRGRGMRERMWRPAAMVCPSGCLAGGTAAAA
jgi:hypothetical protein